MNTLREYFSKRWLSWKPRPIIMLDSEEERGMGLAGPDGPTPTDRGRPPGTDRGQGPLLYTTLGRR